MGKTRLSLEAAARAAQTDQFTAGAYFVPLAGLTAADGIVSAIGQAIQFRAYSTGDPKTQLIDHLRPKAMLLVLDNFEHLLEGAELLSDILQAASGVKIIVTSRARLNLQEETVYRLEGMDFADWPNLVEALKDSVVKLFLQSAQRVEPEFELQPGDLGPLAKICRQLQGMPLGIILAATWVNVLSIEEIAVEIGRSLDFLETQQQNVPSRQRSLRSVFDYSWSLLSEDEREVMAKLSIFRGGFTRDAVQAVTGTSLRGLAALVNKSMLRRDPTGRYEIHELLRQYCQDRLESMPAVQVGLVNCHQDYYMGLLAHHGPDLSTERQLDTAALLKADLDNIDVAWESFIAQAQDETIDLPSYYLTQCCEILGIPLQGQAMFQRTHDVVMADPNRKHGYVAGTLKAYLGYWYSRVNDPRAYDISVQALAMLEGYPPSAGLVYALFIIGSIDADWQQREYYLQKAMQTAKELRLDWIRGMMFYPLTWALHRLGKLDEVFQLGDEVTQMVQENTDYYLRSSLVAYLGYLSMLQGEYEVAKGHYERTLEFGKALNHPARMAWGYDGLSWVASKYNDHASHRDYLLTALACFQEIGQRDHVAREYGNLVHPVVRLGNYDEALSYAREGLSTAQQIHNAEYVVKALVGYADVLNHTGEPERAVELLTLAGNHEALLADVVPFVELYINEAALAPEALESAQARGKSLDLDSTVAAILKAN
jgi:predicted ATPase/tetratricopeptide (TPR) repeat protein